MTFDISKLSEDELVEWNRRIVERLQFIRSAKSLTQLARFSVGMTVEFDTDDGRTISGTVARLNQRTATVVTAAGRWRVSPSLLRLASADGRLKRASVARDRDAAPARLELFPFLCSGAGASDAASKQFGVRAASCSSAKATNGFPHESPPKLDRPSPVDPRELSDSSLTTRDIGEQSVVRCAGMHLAGCRLSVLGLGHCQAQSLEPIAQSRIARPFLFTVRR